MVLSFVNIAIFGMMLVIHIRANRHKLTCVQLFTKVKTMIFILIILLQLTVFIRYTFVISNNNLYQFILITSGFIGSIILFQICYFYTKKASHFLEDNKKIRKLMRTVMYIAIVLFLTFAIYQFFDTHVDVADRSSLCHTQYFILPNMVNQIANCFFLYIGIKVSKNINEFNSHQTALISSNTDL